MSDEITKQDESEHLFDESELDDTADSDGNAEDESTTEDGEEISDNVDELDSKATLAEQNRQKQVDVWAGRVKRKEVTLEQVPKWIREKLGSSEPTLTLEDMKRIAREEVLAEQENARYEELKAQVKSLSLTIQQKKQLTAEFDELISNGYSRSKALEKAQRIVGIGNGSIDRSAAAIPRQGMASSTSDDIDITSAEFRKLPEKKRMAILNGLVKNR